MEQSISVEFWISDNNETVVYTVNARVRGREFRGSGGSLTFAIRDLLRIAALEETLVVSLVLTGDVGGSD